LLSLENQKFWTGKFSKPNHGSSDLAEMAYLENYEFIEGGLQAHDERIMEETEVIFGDLLRELVNKIMLKQLCKCMLKNKLQSRSNEFILSKSD
jgi:hypothetical protein